MKFRRDNKTERGFTLIELLVVIAIIGILAGIVLVALGGARNRAKDARITSEMAQFRTQGEVIFSTADNYDNVDCAIGNIKTLCDDVASQGGTKPSDGSPGVDIVTSGSPVYEYCADVKLNSGNFWCVDSELNSVQGACPTTPPFVCVAGGGGGGGGKYLVFVTSVSGTGNLSSWADAGGFTGLAAGDAVCQARADADPGGFGLASATWRAWLSDSSLGPSTRFSANLRSTTDPIYFVDGSTKIADSWNDLVDGGILVPINKKEDGTSYGGSISVWTGTFEDGTPYAIYNCVNWTKAPLTNGEYGYVGFTDKQDYGWTRWVDIDCAFSKPLYCFSQSPL